MIDDIKQLQAQLKGLVIFFSIFILIIMFIFGLVLDQIPHFWCERWGGKLYTDNKCYLVADMDKCIDSKGLLHDKSSRLSMPGFNWTLPEVE